MVCKHCTFGCCGGGNHNSCSNKGCRDCSDIYGDTDAVNNGRKAGWQECGPVCIACFAPVQFICMVERHELDHDTEKILVSNHFLVKNVARSLWSISTAEIVL